MSTRTIGGRPVHKARVFREGAYWRWEIVLTDGSRYVDGGNYRTEDAARDGLAAALRAQIEKTLARVAKRKANAARKAARGG